MGAFHVGCKLESHTDRTESVKIPRALVTRCVRFAILRVDKHFTIDEVVFGETGDLTLLGARTLDGLSLVVEPRQKKLVAAGPILAA